MMILGGCTNKPVHLRLVAVILTSSDNKPKDDQATKTATPLQHLGLFNFLSNSKWVVAKKATRRWSQDFHDVISKT